MFMDKRRQWPWYARSECFPNKLSRHYYIYIFLGGRGGGGHMGGSAG